RTAWDKAYRKVWRQEEKFLRRYEGKEGTKLERKIGEIAPPLRLLFFSLMQKYFMILLSH
ncbi:MAG: hypothetical protein IIV45_17435, partial [Lachnospiraceae bacterium]|nr:hypothetical protein [Lachnospiraceae bacterium]